MVVLPPLHDAIGNVFANLFLVMTEAAQKARAEIGDACQAHPA
jgi:hypothetical protein